MNNAGLKRLLDEHGERIKRIEAGVPLHPSPPPPRLWTRAKTWIENNKLVSIGLSIVLAAAGIFGGGYFKNYLDHEDDGIVAIADKEISKNVTPLLSELDRKVTETQATLKTLQPFIEDLVRREMGRAAALPSADLRNNLPKIRDLVAVARAQNIAVDQKVVIDLGNSLFEAASPSKSEDPLRNHFAGEPAHRKLAWDVANQVLGYYSSLIKIEKSGYVIRAEDRNQECVSAGAHNIVMRDAIFEHCTQHLDHLFGPSAKEHYAFFQGNVFRDVRVIYAGGPLDLNDVYFVNCTFEMEPGLRSKTLGETLLASARVTLQFH